MFANSQMGGMALGGPDVCLTPPAHLPVPYPNLSAQPMGVPAVYNVLLTCAPAHNMMTQVPLTNGDNAGLEMGLVSHTVMGPSRHVTAAFTVLIGGAPVTRMTSITMQNSVNAPGLSIVPSQVKVLVLAP
ncbi:type VI secretion protein [Sorangium cellulosum]|uniref:Type VI secretion protein n=1 Tax=Sorangium cellulosum TaxID=56 RepID=A0A150P7G2_SORCE|nr:type VI secretion protein [Sorangium cellulosum]